MKVLQRVRGGVPLPLVDCAPPATDIARVALAGLTAQQKTLPCSLFYDEAGAALFERICELPEYYLTRTELSLLRAHMHEIVLRIGAGARVVELGSGGAAKTRLLLRHIRATEYLPIDISRTQLLDTVSDIAREFPAVRVRAVCADYTAPITLPAPEPDVHRTIVFFPGSTIGNFEPDSAEEFLRSIAHLAGKDGALLIGVDLEKDRARVEAAYNDAQGVTAEFNLNLLVRLNRELDADFDRAAFRHVAHYNVHEHRIEMNLISERDQAVHIAAADATVSFRAGEAIVTEYSYKYSIARFTALAARAGWGVEHTWVDADRLFAIYWCVLAV